MKCIICRKIKEKKEFSIEHIIPESLGNSKYILVNVCEKCNSKLGNKVDCELVNFELFTYPRIILNLRGKTGKLPKIFKDAKLEDGRPAFTNYNESTGKLEVNPPPIIKLIEEVDGLRFEIESTSHKEAIEALCKKYKRKTGKELTKEKQEEILKDLNESSNIRNVTIRNTLALDVSKLDVAFIKIAYELIFYFEILDKDLLEYLKDEKIKEFSNIISNYIYKDKITKNLPIISDPIDEEFQYVLRYLSNKFFGHEYCHLICIYSSKNAREIRYRINLLNSLSCSIVIEDIDCKDFKKIIYIDPITFKEFYS